KTKQKNDFEILNSLEDEKNDFLKMCEKAKEYLLSGDIFQVVLSKQLCIKHQVNAFDYYESLSTLNPSAYMFYFPSKYGVVLGSSPEFLLKIKKREIYLAPIAGTRNLENNCDLLALEKDLLSDEKELSEHKMLVDLARNDASKFGTQTRVENLFSIIKNKFVMHIVSEVYANMKEDASIFDVIEAVFPAGTLSGAPKIRALEIISELEDCDRGVYGGAVGFLNFNEDITLAILIRCAFFTQDKAYLASGAGIVLQSESQKEYAEICAKRRALLVAFENLKKENQ
ncbi:anthranilate synthase component I family protein, partial [Campylobacter jejuni]